VVERLWQEVDAYLAGALAPDDEVLRSALAASHQAQLPAIEVTALQGRFLQVLVLALGARRVLEIGTLGGYSAIWMGRALAPGGKLVTLEADPSHAQVARSNLARAGLADKVEVVVGPALGTLPKLAGRDGPGPFDLCFIDADKENNAAYFRWAVQLCRPGGVVVVDNVVRGGRVAEAGSTDPAVAGTRHLFEEMAGNGLVVATALQTVGAKGHDGFAIAVVAP